MFLKYKCKDDIILGNFGPKWLLFSKFSAFLHFNIIDLYREVKHGVCIIVIINASNFMKSQFPNMETARYTEFLISESRTKQKPNIKNNNKD